MEVRYKLEVVDDKYNIKKVVTPEYRERRKRKEKVVGDLCIMISFICFGTDVFIMFFVYPKVWSLFGCCGLIGVIFLMLAFMYFDMDRVRTGVYNIERDFKKYFRSGKIILLFICLLFLVFEFLFLKYVF